MQPVSLVKRAYSVLLREGIIAVTIKIAKFCVLRIELVLALFLAYISPRNEDLIVFANSSERCEFSGNMKYLFLGIANDYDKNCVWLTQYDEIVKLLSDHGYKSCKTDTLKARVYLLRAKYAVTDVDFDSRQWRYLYSATTIQLWHGYPLKQLPEEERVRINARIQIFDYACVNNHVEEAELRTHKNIDKVYYTGYPRNDLFFREIQDAEIGVNPVAQEISERIPPEETVIGYFPTWREYEDVVPIEADIFNTFLEEHNAHCIIKPHGYTDPFVDDTEFERIHVHPPTGDVYPIFKDIDILITDYSSIYFDYMLIDRPVVFLPYDYEDYIKNRGLNLDYDSMTPGPKAYNFDQLLDCLSDLISDDSYSQERKSILDDVFTDYEGEAVSNIYDNILR